MVQKEPKTKKRAHNVLRQDGVPSSPKVSTLHQQILDVFRNAFSAIFDAALSIKIQHVKSALYLRDFSAAFGSSDNLEAYAARWSPSRALAYTSILSEVLREIQDLSAYPNDPEHDLRMLCIGGGAGAELVAAAGLLKSYETCTTGGLPKLQSIQMTAVDIADWSGTLELLHTSTITPPTLSKYAAAHVVAANKAFVQANQLVYDFHQYDVLETKFKEELEGQLHNVNLVTCFFTMNELFSASITRTKDLLFRIKSTLTTGSFLLVIDSAGSYATVSLTNSEKSYPMQWLLDHTMLEADADKDVSDIAQTKTTPSYTWTKIRSEDSTWFRIPDGLKYPLELENMRYQLHLYQKQTKG